jgi:hypothetical protein
MGETAAPECNGGECGGGKTSPKAKVLENKGLKCGSEKKCPLPVNGHRFYNHHNSAFSIFLSCPGSWQRSVFYFLRRYAGHDLSKNAELFAVVHPIVMWF